MHEILNAPEVAKLLRCDVKTVYEAVIRQEIPCRRIGRRVFFSHAALIGWLAAPVAAALPSPVAPPAPPSVPEPLTAIPAAEMARPVAPPAPRPTPLAPFAFMLSPKQLRPAVRRDKLGCWFFRKRLRLPDGTTMRMFGHAAKWNLPNTRAGAVEAQRRAIEQILRASSEPAARPRPPTVAEFAPTYLAIARAHNKFSSADSKNEWLQRHILPKIGHLRLDEVTYAVIEDLKLALLATQVSKRTREDPEKQRTLGRKTINNGLSVLHRMLEIARKRGFIEKVPDIDWFKAPPPEPKFLTFDEADHLLRLAEPEWRAMIIVALRTGLRRGELLALRWQDVDLDNGKLVVQQNAARGRIGTPKSGKSRVIPLSDESVAALREHRRSGQRFVFPNHRGRMFTEHVVERAIRRCYAVAKLPYVGWHVLRHTFASHLVMRGVPLKVIQELLGHATIQMTLRYAHLAPEICREAVNRLDALVQPSGAEGPSA